MPDRPTNNSHASIHSAISIKIPLNEKKKETIFDIADSKKKYHRKAPSSGDHAQWEL